MRKTSMSTEKKEARFFLSLVPVFLGAFLATLPAPAKADIPVIDKTLIAQELSVWKPLTGTFIMLFNKRMDDLSGAITNSAAGQAKTAGVAAQGVANTVFTAAKAVNQGQNATTKATTDEAKNAICSQVLAMQISSIAEAWADSLADFLDNTTYTFGGTSYCRGPWAGHGKAADCSGPLGMKEFLDARCNVLTGNDFDDSSTDKCKSKDKNLWGLDKSPMRAIFGANVRKMFASPASSSGSTKDAAHGTVEAAQNYFRAAVNACYNLYGLPASQPAKLSTPADASLLVQAQTVEANRRVALRECLRNLADNTIPPKEGDAKLVEAHNKMKQLCENARARKLDVSRFQNCNLSISRREADKLVCEMCTTTSQYKALAGTTNASEKDISAAALACASVSQACKAADSKRQSDFANIVASMAGK